jgi:hypothetical protein
VLGEHRTTVGVVPIAMLLADDGVLATLAARGYRVLGPDEHMDEAIESAVTDAAP